MKAPKTESIVPSLLLLTVLAATGCMKSERFSPEQLGQIYRRTPSQWAEATPLALTYGQITIPSRVTVTQERDLFKSALDLASVRDRLLSGSADFRLLIADEMAESAASALREIADRTEAWAEATEEYARPAGRERWSRDTAAMLVLLYRIDRGPAAVDPREELRRDRSTAAALSPVLRSLALYMMKRMEVETGQGEILDALGDQRQLPVEFMLRAAFRQAALEMPPEAPAEVMKVFDQGPPTAIGIERELRDKLELWRARAEERPRSAMSRRVGRYLKTVPYLLNTMARFLDQWDKFYLVSAELGQAGEDEVVSLVLDVQPGHVVRLDAVHRMAPVLTMEGRTRINFWLADTADEEQVRVQFIDERGGRVAIRFESWVYGLASLFTFPIEDWVLREIAVTTSRPERHHKVTVVQLLLETRRYKGPADDPRRLMQIRTDRQLEVATKGDVVNRLVRHDTAFKFFAPRRMWHYERVSQKILPRP